MNIQNDPSYIEYDINTPLDTLVDAHNQVIIDNPGEGNPRRQPPSIRPQEYYKKNVNITEADGPLVLPFLPHGHSFVVTSSLMLNLTTRGLFSGLSYEDPHAQISKLWS